jgi:hypothetical protein
VDAEPRHGLISAGPEDQAADHLGGGEQRQAARLGVAHERVDVHRDQARQQQQLDADGDREARSRAGRCSNTARRSARLKHTPARVITAAAASPAASAGSASLTVTV